MTFLSPTRYKLKATSKTLLTLPFVSRVISEDPWKEFLPSAGTFPEFFFPF